MTTKTTTPAHPAPDFRKTWTEVLDGVECELGTCRACFESGAGYATPSTHEDDTLGGLDYCQDCGEVTCAQHREFFGVAGICVACLAKREFAVLDHEGEVVTIERNEHVARYIAADRAFCSGFAHSVEKAIVGHFSDGRDPKGSTREHVATYENVSDETLRTLREAANK